MAIPRHGESERADARCSESGPKLTVRGALIDDVAFVSESHECFEENERSLDQDLDSMRTRLLPWEDEMESCLLSHSLYNTREQRLKIWKGAILHETEDSWLGQQYDRSLGHAVPTDGAIREAFHGPRTALYSSSY